MMDELLNAIQSGCKPLLRAAIDGHSTYCTCVEHLLNTPGIDLSIMDKVS